MALAVLPLIDAVLGFAGFRLLWAVGGRAFFTADPAPAAFAFAVLSGLAGLLVTWCAAAPMVVARLRRGPISLQDSVVAGLLLGNTPFGLYIVGLVIPATFAHVMAGTMAGRWLSVPELAAATLRMLFIGSTMGAASGAIFWFLGIRGGEND